MIQVTESVVELLQGLRASGTTVLVVEQSLDLALRIADRTYFLEHGEIRFDGAPDELMERHDLLRAVFIGDTTATGTAGPVAPDRRDVDAPAPRLVVDGIAKRFGGVVALDAVSFAVGPGEIVGFVGANGAWKTTLFDLLSGFIPADAGTIALRPGDGPVALMHASIPGYHPGPPCQRPPPQSPPCQSPSCPCPSPWGLSCGHGVPDVTGEGGAAFATPKPIPRAVRPSAPAMVAPAAIVFRSIMRNP